MVYGTTREGQPFVPAQIIEIYLLKVLFEAENCTLQSHDAMDRIEYVIDELVLFPGKLRDLTLIDSDDRHPLSVSMRVILGRCSPEYDRHIREIRLELRALIREYENVLDVVEFLKQ